MRQNKHISLALIVALLATSTAQAGGDACKPVCDDLKMNSVLDAQGVPQHARLSHASAWSVEKYCGPKPPPAPPSSSSSSSSSNTSPPPAKGTGLDGHYQPGGDLEMSGDPTWDACYVDYKIRFDHIAGYCQAIEISNVTAESGKNAAIAYGVAMGLCLIACLARNTGYGAVLEAACVGGALAGAGVEAIGLKNQIESSGEFSPERDIPAIVEGIASIGTAIGTTVASDAADSCYATGAMFVIAGAKLLTISMQTDTSDSACLAIQSMGGWGSTFSTKLPPTDPTTAGARLSGAPNTTTPTGQAPTTGGDGGGNPDSGQDTDEHIAENLSTRFAALAGDAPPSIKSTLKGLQPNKFAEAAKAAGTSLKALQQAAATGGTAGVLAALEDVNPNVKGVGEEMKKKFDEIAKQQKLATPSSGGGKGGGGGSGTAGRGSSFGGLFGSKTPAGGTGTLSFGKNPKDALSAEASDGDVFHANFKGSIFQIVSKKLEKSRARVEALEWISPLNRALAGMKQLKPGESNAPKPVPVNRGAPMHNLR